jgi:hypothetical protein
MESLCVHAEGRVGCPPEGCVAAHHFNSLVCTPAPDSPQSGVHLVEQILRTDELTAMAVLQSLQVRRFVTQRTAPRHWGQQGTGNSVRASGIQGPNVSYADCQDFEDSLRFSNFHARRTRTMRLMRLDWIR